MQIFFSCSLKFIAYNFSAVNVVLPNHCNGPLSKIKISLFLLSICADELISALNIMALLPNPLPSDNEKVPFRINPIP